MYNASVYCYIDHPSCCNLSLASWHIPRGVDLDVQINYEHSWSSSGTINLYRPLSSYLSGVFSCRILDQFLFVGIYQQGLGKFVLYCFNMKASPKNIATYSRLSCAVPMNAITNNYSMCQDIGGGNPRKMIDPAMGCKYSITPPYCSCPDQEKVFLRHPSPYKPNCNYPLKLFPSPIKLLNNQVHGLVTINCIVNESIYVCKIKLKSTKYIFMINYQVSSVLCASKKF